jgi:zinc protease
MVSAQMPPQNESRVFGTIRDELRRLATEPAPAPELERVKSALLYSYAFDAQTVFDRAKRLCLFEIMSKASMADTWPKLIQGVTAEDVLRAASRYLGADLASYSVVRPSGSTGPTQQEIEALLPPWRQSWPTLASAAPTKATSAVRRETLSSGVTLLLKEDHATPIVAVATMARGGQWIEPDSLAGVSNMAATLLRRGAGSMSAGELSERADALGMRLTTEGAPDYASVSWVAPAANFSKAWGIYRGVMLHPSFPSSEISKAREDLIRDIQSIGDRPFDNTNLHFAQALYKKSPYRRNLEGDEASVKRIRATDLRHAYETMFCGSNLVIAVVGDFDANQALELARHSFGGMRCGKPVTIGGIQDEPAREKRPIFIEKDQEQVTYNTGWLTCSVRDADYVPVKVATTLLGTQVFFKYVYERGVAYRSWFYTSDRMGQSSAQNEMGVTPANFPMASSGVLADARQTFQGPLSQAELQKTRDTLLSRWYLGAQQSDQVADRLCYFETAGLGFEYVDRYPDLVKKVTPDQVLAVAHKYFNPDTWTRVAVGKEEANSGAPSAAPGH